MMRALRRSALLVLWLGLAACSGTLPPFETVPPALHKGDDAQVTRVSVCYNALTTTAEQVRAIASQSCGPDTTPRPVERDFSLRNCPLLQPARATFACVGS